MRQGQQNNKRMRGRNRKGPNPLSRTYESNGPDVKIRGTALHIAEKYGQLARDAQSSGDRVAAENYYQHAEHYYRIIAAAQAQMPYPPQQVFRNDDGGEEDFDEAGFGRRPNPQPGQGRPESFNRDTDQPSFPADTQSYPGNGQAMPAGPAPGTGEQPTFGEEEMDEPMPHANGGPPDQNQFRRRRRPYRGGGRPEHREGNFNPGPSTGEE